MQQSVSGDVCQGKLSMSLGTRHIRDRLSDPAYDIAHSLEGVFEGDEVG